MTDHTATLKVYVANTDHPDTNVGDLCRAAALDLLDGHPLPGHTLNVVDQMVMTANRCSYPQCMCMHRECRAGRLLANERPCVTCEDAKIIAEVLAEPGRRP